MLLNHSEAIRIGEWKNASKLEESLEDRADLLRQHMGSPHSFRGPQQPWSLTLCTGTFSGVDAQLSKNLFGLR